ncbi:purine and uridine phosphorylase [Atractiella rhizophila]|nr:purine and uridine phosphorylase [Atractiella rhizophila]
MKHQIADANFPRDGEGRVYHLSLKTGELANRILIVGDLVRARRISVHLDKDPKPIEVLSQRGFLTFTGKYKGVPISICATGMGFPMTDFFVREARAVVNGDMAIIRFGSCGGLTDEVPPGALSVPKSAFAVTRNYDYFSSSNSEGDPYLISGTVDADPQLTELLGKNVKAEFTGEGKDQIVQIGATHASADSFYSSQDASFNDSNQDLLNKLKAKHPSVSTLEMETQHLFHLARSCRNGTISAAGVHMVFAGRTGGSFISPEKVKELEPGCGRVCLETLIGFEMDKEQLMEESEFTWGEVKKELGTQVAEVASMKQTH